MRWEQRDAADLVRRVLIRAVVDGHNLVRSEVPAGWTPTSTPVCTVVGDGTPHTTRGWTREVVRVTVYGRYGPQVRQLMTTLDGILLMPRVGYAISPSTGVIATTNSRLGGWVASATYNVATNRKVVA
ncbi:MAG: hypothetical protein Q4F65_05885 [Propionibacteriaceae bacterium]|nr:hypothetical protein [Propionibacteriaceae bacterium]